jgi:hypothetical protein
MKKRILIAIAALMVFGLAIAAVAYTNTKASVKASTGCCCKSDGAAESCPMKSKDAGKESGSCCDKEDCCCKSGAESCPMKSKDEAKPAEKSKPSCCDKEAPPAPKKDGEAAGVDMTNVVVASSGEGCCCPCCGAKKDS